MPTPITAQATKYAATSWTWERPSRPAETMTVPAHITERAPARSISRPTVVEITPITTSAMLKPRKIVLIAQPVSAPIGLASTPRQ